MAAAGCYLAIVCFSGGHLGEVALFALVLALYLVLPGFFWLRLAKRWPLPEGFDGPLALLLGAGFFAALYCISMLMGALMVLRLVPPLLGLAAGALWLRDQKPGSGRLAGRAQKRPLPQQWLLVLLFCGLLVLFSFYGAAKNGRPLAVGAVLPNQDLYWNVGNANSFKLAFPPKDIHYTGVSLRYHFLTEMLAGALSLVSGISAYNILAFYLQPYMLGALVLCLYRLGLLVFGGRQGKAQLFTWAFFLFGCASLWAVLPGGGSLFNNDGIIHLVTNINSQATATVLLCIFVGLFAGLARRSFKGGWCWPALVVAAFFMLCFAKGPLAALVAVAALLAMAAAGLMKTTHWRGVLLGGCIAAVFAGVYVLIFRGGANSSMVFDWFNTIGKGAAIEVLNRLPNSWWYVALPFVILLQSFLMLPAQFPLYLRGLLADVRHFTKLTGERLFYNAVAVGGLLAFFLFDHRALSQTYFLYGATFFINLLAVDGTDRLPALWQKAGFGKAGGPQKKAPGRPLAARLALGGLGLCLAAGVATSAFLYVHMLGSGARQLGRNLGLIEKYPYALVATAQDEAAMLWLRDNSPTTAVFATNRIHSGPALEGISNVYSAFCERQGFMEGVQYTITNMGVTENQVETRKQVNEALFSPDTPPQQVVELCRQQGIDYLVFSTQMDGIGGDERQLAALDRVWESEDVRIYALPKG